MTKTVEFFFDFASATSYLAYTQLPKIAAPTFFVAEQMFFGQDRLEFVREALA